MTKRRKEEAQLSPEEMQKHQMALAWLHLVYENPEGAWESIKDLSSEVYKSLETFSKFTVQEEQIRKLREGGWTDLAIGALMACISNGVLPKQVLLTIAFMQRHKMASE